MPPIEGKVWKFGHSIDTDIIIPARHLILPLSEMKTKAMEPMRPTFAAEFEPGDIIVAGRSFGCGSSREQAPAVLWELGVAAIVAESFARIFFRNAINLGMPIVECHGIWESVEEGDTLRVDLPTGRTEALGRGLQFQGSIMPNFLMEIIESGGLIRHLKSTAHLPVRFSRGNPHD